MKGRVSTVQQSKWRFKLLVSPKLTRPEQLPQLSSFRERVLLVVASIPAGQVLTYGAVAIMAGSPRAARGVGAVLSAHGGTVPWWRVVQASGHVAPARPHNADRVQRALLEAEDVQFQGARIDLDRFGWQPPQNDEEGPA